MIKRIVIFSIIMIILGLFTWVKFFHSEPFLPIHTISISGNLIHQDELQLKQQLQPFAHMGFFDLSVQNLQSDIQELSWVEEADVKRVWPNKISIYIHRQQPIAIWNDTKLLDAYGEKFKDFLSQDQLNQLPKFYGEEDSIMTILDYYQRMNRLLAPINLSVLEIHLTPSQLWTVQLSNGIKIKLGDEDVLTRLSRFVTVYPKIFASKVHKIGEVDLEYPHGFAVQDANDKKH